MQQSVALWQLSHRDTSVTCDVNRTRPQLWQFVLPSVWCVLVWNCELRLGTGRSTAAATWGVAVLKLSQDCAAAWFRPSHSLLKPFYRLPQKGQAVFHVSCQTFIARCNSIAWSGLGKGKAVPLQARSGPGGSSKLRFPGFMTTAQDGGKVVSLTHRPPLTPGSTPGTHFC
jgi:hypothetical protein